MSGAFERLHKDIQRVLWDMKWESLRQFQADAIQAWFDKRSDLILMANTAAGKTEAAFLPILSSIAEDTGSGSVRVLYIGPLKALINDQFRRVEDLCKRAEIPVHRWHGDVGADKKRNVLKDPSGVLLITPESLEALLMRRGRDIRRVVARLEAVVIDEMHVFLDSERGRQLCTQLRRIDVIREGAPPARRVGLSATIGDVETALTWIQRNGKDEPLVIRSEASREIELLVKTFVHERPAPKLKAPEVDSAEGSVPEVDESSDLLSVAQHISENMKGTTNLVFCNRKSDIEVLADDLGEICERTRRANEYIVHHGSLSKQIRESVEAELQSGRPCTALCSSTLELGIDVGYVDSVGQLGPPHSVSALKQRLGRSGRRPGQPSRLWLYVPELRRSAKDPLPERLYPRLLQSAAMVTLMLQKWTEPPTLVTEDYSTLIQQTLSAIAERGGINAAEAHRLLCGTPAFSAITPELYMSLLRDLGTQDLVNQAPNKDLILGLQGEKITGHYEFYAAFEAADEYDVLEATRHIGSVNLMPGMYQPGDNLLLAGKRWKIVEVDEEQQVLLVKRTRDRKPPLWQAGGGHVHRRIRERMRELLVSSSTPPFLDPMSVDVLQWARQAAAATVGHRNWVEDEGGLFAFTWAGSRAHFTLNLIFRAAGVSVTDHEIAFGIDGDGKEARSALREFVVRKPSPVELVSKAFPEEVPLVGKHGIYLGPELRARAFAAKHVSMEEAFAKAEDLLNGS
jgi:ATP-dependent helicase Lhr and Lhr-like helicase